MVQERLLSSKRWPVTEHCVEIIDEYSEPVDFNQIATLCKSRDYNKLPAPFGFKLEIPKGAVLQICVEHLAYLYDEMCMLIPESA